MLSITFVAMLALSGLSHSAPRDEISGGRRAFNSCAGVEGLSYVHDTKTICIRESITRATSEKFHQIWAERSGEVEFIVVSGPGGQLTPALDIAETIRESQLPVVVGDICASSCSQFLFVGAFRKILLQGGLLAFHGGPLTDEYIAALDIPDSSRTFLVAENVRFADFYREIGVDMRMLREPPPHIAEALGRGQFVMWTWPAERLVQFGVSGLSCEDATTQPSSD